MVSSLRPSLYIEGVCSKTPLVPLDSYSLPFGLPPALSSSGGLEVSCCKSGFTVLPLGLSLALCLQVVRSKENVMPLDLQTLPLGLLTALCLQLVRSKKRVVPTSLRNTKTIL